MTPTSIFRCAVLLSSFFFFFFSPSLPQRADKMSPEGKKLLNIIILGFSFMFMFTAFQTCGNIEVSVLACVPEGSRAASDNTQSPLFPINLLPSSSQQTVIKSFNSTEFHGSGYTRCVAGVPAAFYTVHIVWIPTLCNQITQKSLRETVVNHFREQSLL